MTMPVLQNVRWGPVEIEDPSTGDSLTIPLDGVMLVRRTFLPQGRVDGSNPMWPLPGHVDASLQLVFACEQDFADPSNFLPPTEQAMAEDGFMPDPGGSAGGAPLRILICCELVLWKERSDFEPLGILSAARIHPSVLLISNQVLSKAAVTVKLTRPPTSGMTDPSKDNGVGSALFTDTNDNSARLTFLTEILKSQLIPLDVSVPDTPLWDNLFDYYLVDAPAASSFVVVDPALSPREITGAIQTLGMVTGSYTAMPFNKVARQGAYDNVHLAPKMIASAPLLAPDPITMAPGCIHDCLHIHWRWGGMWGSSTLSWLPNNLGLKGWDATGLPYRVFGAPQVPTNQRVAIVLVDPRSMDYTASLLTVPAGTWQYVFHHGGAYSVAINVASTVFANIVGAINAVITTTTLGTAIPTLPASPTSWGLQEWARFYAVLRFQPSVAGPLERISMLDRGLAES